MKIPIFTLEQFSFKYPFSKMGIFVKDVIKIYQNDFVIIVGDSGVGKSSLLYALKGFYPNIIYGEITGDILYKNLSLINYTDDYVNTKIALLHQNPYMQLIHTKVIDELAFGLENLKFTPTKILEIINIFANQFKVEYLLNRDITNLSSGEAQKIALLSLLITNPDVLLLDEPTAFLDPTSANFVFDIINQYIGNKTIVCVEHNLQYFTQYIDIFKDNLRFLEIQNTGEVIEIDVQLYKQKYLPTFTQYYSKSEYNSAEYHKSKLNISQPLINHTKQPLLQIKNLSFSYSHNKKLLDNISFEVYPHEILGIVGDSGSGKSTILALLAKLIPVSNTIFFNNVDIVNIKNRVYYKELGLLFQKPEYHFLFSTVIQEVNYNKQTLELLNLQNFANNNPFILSQGQKRRLSYASIFLEQDDNMHIKKIILLDEPTFGQDNKNKAILVNLIIKLRMLGASFIIVSHDYEFLKLVCDRVLNINNHQLVANYKF